MNPILILREEIVCLIILIYMAFLSRSFRMGKEGKVFHRIMLFALAHVVLDAVTIWTVNHPESVSRPVNDIAHILFFLTAIFFSGEIMIYVFSLCRPKRVRDFRIAVEAVIAVYAMLVCFRVLTIEYEQFNGTKSSVGPAPTAGFALCFVFFVSSIAMIVRNRQQIGKHIRLMLLPTLLLLIVVELIQMNVKEFLFTGATITAITVGLFFSLENPAAVLERKIMMDALSGLGSRSSYEHDIEQYDAEFRADRAVPFTFVFIDINNLRSVNGLFGHQEGDAYISEMAVLLISNMRNATHIYRMGGDEFLALYRKIDEKTVVKDIKRVHDACRKEGEKKDYTPELAIGYAVSNAKYNTLRDVLRVADYMMYRNKAEIKREVAEGIRHENGTRMNLYGLTDRVFDAMCLTSEEFYPYISNLETDVTRVAPGMAEFFGLEGEFIQDFMSVWMERIHPADRDGYESDLRQAMKGQKDYHYYRYRARGKDGQYVELTCRGGLYHGRDGEPDIFSGYIVNHGLPQTRDDLTGLQNVNVLMDRIEDAVNSRGSAIIMRLEPKGINRTRMLYGANMTAKSTRALANLCRETVKGQGEVFGSAGRYYTFYLPDCKQSKAEEIFSRIREICAGGLLVDDVAVPMDVCAGAVQLPAINLTDVESVRSAILFATEEAAYSQREGVVFYRQDAAGFKGGEMQLLRTIHHDCVMNRANFFLRFQPIISSETETVTGAEALLRYRNPEFGEVAPGRFISFLESDPGYTELGFDIIRYSALYAGRIRKTLPEFNVNVNITALQLYAEDFIPRVLQILEEEKYPPEHLILELTERCKEMDFNFLKQRVEELRATGIRVALDDMGTGFSTIDLLLHLPVNEIKVDMEFTRHMQENDKDIRFAELLAHIAEENQMLLCFEGVEDRELRDYLRRFGKVILQGYYFDKPLMIEEFEKKYCAG
ncbi:MAG: EAL domain-containing protein [Clostridia bacterium]|nr:EAL domain-containing protein [Clostridia bacterium]